MAAWELPLSWHGGVDSGPVDLRCQQLNARATALERFPCCAPGAAEAPHEGAAFPTKLHVRRSSGMQGDTSRRLRPCHRPRPASMGVTVPMTNPVVHHAAARGTQSQPGLLGRAPRHCHVAAGAPQRGPHPHHQADRARDLHLPRRRRTLCAEARLQRLRGAEERAGARASISTNTSPTMGLPQREETHHVATASARTSRIP